LPARKACGLAKALGLEAGDELLEDRERIGVR
jgi:hypothetical protein